MNTSLQKRNQGIDLLRIVSMLMIVTLHILGYGKSMVFGSPAYIATAFLKAACACSVNCYALVSGFVGYKPVGDGFLKRARKYIVMWLGVVLYSAGITACVFILKYPAMEWKTLLKSFCPVTINMYWYFTAYTVVFICAPFIHKALTAMQTKTVNRIGIAVLLCVPTYLFCSAYIFDADSLSFGNGYSAAWLLVLYIIGAWVKICRVWERVKAWQMGAICAVSVAVGYVFMLRNNYWLCYYTCPTTVWTAVAVLILFVKWGERMRPNKRIAFCEPVSLGVYLIHEQLYVRNDWIHTRFYWIADLHPAVALVATVGCSVGIFAVCGLIEKARIAVFQLLQVDTLVEKLLCAMKRAVGKLTKRGCDG